MGVASHPPLTDRQLHVLGAYLRSGTAKAAAHELHVSLSTVKGMLGGIRDSRGVTNTAQAAYVAGAEGWLRDETKGRLDIAD